MSLLLPTTLRVSSPFLLNNVSQQARGMASLRELRMRIKSVDSAKKLTTSMKTVAASKLKPAEGRKDRVLPFLRSSLNIAGTTPLVVEPKKHLIIALASDRGLCGAVNGQVIRKTKALIKEFPAGSEVEIITLGERVKAGLLRDYFNIIPLTITELDKKPFTFFDFSLLADELINRKYDVLHLISNRWVNVLSFDTQVLNIPKKEFLAARPDLPKGVDGDEKDIINNFYSYYLASVLFSSVVESGAVELAARRAAMDSASKNAIELGKALVLERNRKRQAIITNELIEIISGAEGIADKGIEE